MVPITCKYIWMYFLQTRSDEHCSYDEADIQHTPIWSSASFSSNGDGYEMSWLHHNLYRRTNWLATEFQSVTLEEFSPVLCWLWVLNHKPGLVSLYSKQRNLLVSPEIGTLESSSFLRFLTFIAFSYTPNSSNSKWLKTNLLQKRQGTGICRSSPCCLCHIYMCSFQGKNGKY